MIILVQPLLVLPSNGHCFYRFSPQPNALVLHANRSGRAKKQIREKMTASQQSSTVAWQEQQGVLLVLPKWVILTAVICGKTDVGALQLGALQLGFSQVGLGDSN